MDSIHDHALSGIPRLELELIVRDLTAVLNHGQSHDIAAFLDEHIAYRPTPNRLITGRTSVIAMLVEIRETFPLMTTTLDAVAVMDQTVLVEQTVQLALPCTAAQRLMGFASFRFEGLQVAEWHQLHA